MRLVTRFHSKVVYIDQLPRGEVENKDLIPHADRRDVLGAVGNAHLKVYFVLYLSKR